MSLDNSLRHGFAMRLIERGVGIKSIGDVLGHRGLENTCVYPAEAVPRVAQCHHEQPRALPAATHRVEREGAFTVVDLCFLTGSEFQPVELPRLAGTQRRHEALDAVVAVAEAVNVHQVLVDGHGVALEFQLHPDELPPRFACRRMSRWPGWGSLLRRRLRRRWGRAGGHPGRICRCGFLLIAADRLAVDARGPGGISI